MNTGIPANIVLATESPTTIRPDEPWVRPTHVASPLIDTLCAAMRFAGRLGLIHYAAASYRDDIAWQVCLCWVADPSAQESTLLVRARRAAGK